jgi:hypothetical protein
MWSVAWVTKAINSTTVPFVYFVLSEPSDCTYNPLSALQLLKASVLHLLPGLDQTWWLTWCTKWTLDRTEFEETFGAAKLLCNVYLVMDMSHTSSNDFFLNTLRWVRLGLLQISWEWIYVSMYRDNIMYWGWVKERRTNFLAHVIQTLPRNYDMIIKVKYATKRVLWVRAKFHGRH